MIFERCKMAVKALLGRNNAGRNISIEPDDIVLASYPKSGNTWMRFLVANLITEEPVTFENIENIIPDIYVWDDARFKNMERPRILKSHEYFDPRYGKTIYIVRDPRDVVVSYYHHHIKFNLIRPDCRLDDFVERFVEGLLDPFGSWGGNVGSWLGARRHSSSFLLVRYEDLLSSPTSEMKRVAEHLGLDRTDSQLDGVIEKSSFDNMKKMEKKQTDSWKALDTTRKDMPFVRDGKKGGWKKVLSEKAVCTIEGAWGDIMSELGYWHREIGL